MGQVIGAAVGLEQVVRDRIFELLGECLVTHTLRMSSSQHRLCLLGQRSTSSTGRCENFSDLAAGQSRVAVQDDGNPLFVAEHPKVGDDRRGGGRSAGAHRSARRAFGLPRAA